MKSTGMIRKIDDLGRIVIPMEIRNALDLEKHAAMEIFVEGDNIVLTRHTTSCLFCGEKETPYYFHGKMICRNCMNELKKQTD